jgi:hypothetical protein
VWSLSKSVRSHSSTECHRTTRANIRSHLYGRPQGWNPHIFGPECYLEGRIKPSSCSDEGCSSRRSRWPGHVPGRASFAYVPNALLYLRASDAVETRQDASALRRFVLRPMGGFYLRPSNEHHYAMRLHALWELISGTREAVGSSEQVARNIARLEASRSSHAACVRSD